MENDFTSLGELNGEKAAIRGSVPWTLAEACVISTRGHRAEPAFKFEKLEEENYSAFISLEIFSKVSLSGICEVTAETFSFLIAS
jgi:hypothetical protein